jgi:hypothetical protein
MLSLSCEHTLSFYDSKNMVQSKSNFTHVMLPKKLKEEIRPSIAVWYWRQPNKIPPPVSQKIITPKKIALGETITNAQLFEI